MASNRHLARIVAMQALFELAFGLEIGLIQVGDQSSIKSIIDRSIDVYKMSVKDQEFCRDLYYGSIENLDALDQIIAPAAPEWPIGQISKVDLAILRLSVFELTTYDQITPYKVIINEAVEVAKSFGGENSSKFVNGVLATVYKEQIESKQGEDYVKTD
ncbi:transcription antitermination factor NusB [Candidatus Saccharibacteria bacterium]|nr:transcription antitermination factor NusB [Candidatus Saccharibacteria bacterium]